MTPPAPTAPSPPASAERPARRGRNGARRLAAVSTRGDRTFVVLAVLEEGGAAAGARGVRVTESVAFARTEADQAARLLTRHKVERIIGVVPGEHSVCRISRSPLAGAGQADADALSGALDLLAEAEMGAIAAPHRRSAGLVRPGGPESAPAALAQAWTGVGQDGPGLLPQGVEPHAWITSPAALAALAETLGGARLAAHADRAAGCASLIAAAADQAAARVARLDNSDGATWRAELAESCDEILASLGLEPGTEIAEDGLTLIPAHNAGVSPENGPFVGGLPHGTKAGAPGVSAWLRDYGLCAGALAVAASEEPALRSLASLHHRAPQQAVSPLLRIVNWLGQPKRAAAVAAACVLIALLLPAGAAYGRWWLLKEQAGGRAALSQQLDEARDAAEFHELLKDERWPMAKLLADVASSAPEGIQLDVLDLSRSGGLSVRGTAETTGLITQFRENLAKTRVFAAIEVPTRAESAADVEFQLNARVESPRYSSVVVDDFAERTMFHRIYGDDAVPSDAPASTRGDTASSAGRAPSRSGRREAAAQGAGPPRESASEGPVPASAPARAASRRDAASAAEIPPPLTDEALAAMDAPAATAEMSKRTEALKRTDLDEATRQRLREEQSRAQRRMLEAFQERNQ